LVLPLTILQIKQEIEKKLRVPSLKHYPLFFKNQEINNDQILDLSDSPLEQFFRMRFGTPPKGVGLIREEPSDYKFGESQISFEISRDVVIRFHLIVSTLAGKKTTHLDGRCTVSELKYEIQNMAFGFAVKDQYSLYFGQ